MVSTAVSKMEVGAAEFSGARREFRHSNVMTAKSGEARSHLGCRLRATCSCPLESCRCRNCHIRCRRNATNRADVAVGRRQQMECRHPARHRWEGNASLTRSTKAKSVARELLCCKRRLTTATNDHERFLSRTRRALARKPGVACGRAVGKPNRRFAVARPTGSLGGARRARQRRALRLLIRI